MGRTLRRVTATLLTVAVSGAVVLSFAASARAAPLTDQQRADRAAAYLRAHQRENGSIVAFSAIGSTADAVSAFVAAGVGRTAMTNAIGYLRAQVALGHVTQIGQQAKVVIAVDAAGLNPATFGGTNLLATISSTIGSGGHYGTSAVLDDALVMLAIESSGAVPPTKAAVWLLEAQCPDGGWAYDKPYDKTTGDNAHCSDGPKDFFPSDSNTTSYVVQALANMSDTDWVHDPFGSSGFFSHLRDKVRGGWPYSSGLPTDANSTALVVQAYRAAKLAVPVGSIQALRNLQYTSCGAFAYSWSKGTRTGADVGATIGAILGLLRKPFPVSGEVAAGVPAVPKCT
jgi:hypothetical protein